MAEPGWHEDPTRVSAFLRGPHEVVVQTLVEDGSIMVDIADLIDHLDARPGLTDEDIDGIAACILDWQRAYGHDARSKALLVALTALREDSSHASQGRDPDSMIKPSPSRVRHGDGGSPERTIS